MGKVDLAVSRADSPPQTADESGFSIVGAIPARFASTRLPGKVLLPLAGRPMIEHVYRRTAAAPGLSRVVVLTDDERVGVAVDAFGGEWEMTPADCQSGTDRIAHAARNWTVDAVINVQGDEPLIDPEAIGRVATHLRTHPDDPMVTLAAQDEEAILEQPDVVKVVTDLEGFALYFSRAAIPYPRGAATAKPLRHVGIYGYRRHALLELADSEQTPLERAESLEQLRALQMGIAIRVLPVQRAWWGVDTMEDLQRVDRYLREQQGQA